MQPISIPGTASASDAGGAGATQQNSNASTGVNRATDANGAPVFAQVVRDALNRPAPTSGGASGVSQKAGSSSKTSRSSSAAADSKKDSGAATVAQNATVDPQLPNLVVMPPAPNTLLVSAPIALDSQQPEVTGDVTANSDDGSAAATPADAKPGSLPTTSAAPTNPTEAGADASAPQANAAFASQLARLSGAFPPTEPASGSEPSAAGQTHPQAQANDAAPAADGASGQVSPQNKQPGDPASLSAPIDIPNVVSGPITQQAMNSPALQPPPKDSDPNASPASGDGSQPAANEGSKVPLSTGNATPHASSPLTEGRLPTLSIGSPSAKPAALADLSRTAATAPEKSQDASAEGQNFTGQEFSAGHEKSTHADASGAPDLSSTTNSGHETANFSAALSTAINFKSSEPQPPANTPVIVATGPASNSDRTPASTASAAPAAPPPALSSPSTWPSDQAAGRMVNSAQLIEAANHSEMRIAMDTDKLGAVELRAHLVGDAIGAAISVEKRDAHAVLAVELPALQQALSEKQLRIEQVTLLHGSFGSTTGDSGASGRQDARGPSSQPAVAAWSANASAATRLTGSAEHMGIFDSQGRLSVHA